MENNSNQPLVQKIYTVRGHRVILDSDLAELYGVTAKRLNEQVRRNEGRFPDDFMFKLTKQELTNLRSQIATSSLHGGRRYTPYVFTEQGVAMLSSVLHSERAVQVNIEIMRAFVRMREFMNGSQGLEKKLNQLEKKYESRLDDHDMQFKVVFDAIRQLINPSIPNKRRKIGF